MSEPIHRKLFYCLIDSLPSSEMNITARGHWLKKTSAEKERDLEAPVALGAAEALPRAVVVLQVELQRLGVFVALPAQRALERLDVHVHRHVARQRRLREERLVAGRAVQQSLPRVQLQENSDTITIYLFCKTHHLSG